MTSPVSLLPQLTGSVLPVASLRGLSPAQERLAAGLQTKMALRAPHIEERWRYYDGLQRMQNLGISVPPTLANVRTVVDWPRICVDPIIDRLHVDGLRLAGATDADDELAEHWHANDLDAELPLGFLDSFVAGCGYVIVGAPDTPGDSPIVTVESPLNMAVQWDPRTRTITAAYQAYEAEGIFRAVLYLPDQTIAMSRDQSSPWTVDKLDQHNFGEVPVIRLPNRARTSDREGRSEITPAVMNTTDEAVRTLLGMAIGREFYSVPHRYGLGMSESDFQDAEGNPKTAWDAAMNKFFMAERDEEGNLPTLGQFTAMDPSVFTKIIDKHGTLMSSYTGFPPEYFGVTSAANPASADAIRVAENRLVSRGKRAQHGYSGPLRQMGRLMWRFAHNGELPPVDVKRMEVDWADPATPTPAATTDAMFKQAQMGAVSPTSDVVLSRLGYSALERARLAIDRTQDAGESVLAELATSLRTKEARADVTVARDINPQAVTNTPPANDGTNPTGQSGR